MSVGFIGLHVGAGHHSVKKTKEYKAACNKACLKGITAIRLGMSSLDAAAEAVATLEDLSCTNAGYGSSLNEDGQVECDASVMEGSRMLFGGVGAITGIQNPVHVAKKLLTQQAECRLTLGRIPPSFLVGQGARDWAVKNGIASISPCEMISMSAHKTYGHYYKQLKIVDDVVPKKKQLEDLCNLSNIVSNNGDDDEFQVCKPVAENNENSLQDVMDTVGAVCVDQKGKVAAAVSSGGIILKQPGRVGQAGVYGCGCWAEDGNSMITGTNNSSVAACTTGCGESLIRTIFARECALRVQKHVCPTTALQQTVQETFLDSKYFTNQQQRLAGAMVLNYSCADKCGELLWVHSTDSMCVGFMSTSDKHPQSRMSRLPSGSIAGHAVVVEGAPFKL